MNLWKWGQLYLFQKPEIIGNCHNVTLKKDSLPDKITIRIQRDGGYFYMDITVSLKCF